MNTDIVIVYIQSLEKRIDKQDEILKEFRNQFIRENILIEKQEEKLREFNIQLIKFLK